MTCIWKSLPNTLTKLVLDLNQAFTMYEDGNYQHKFPITSADMKLLLEMTKLQELRLFGMQSSLQPVIWETVFRNTSDKGLRVLELQMVAAPLVRPGHWRKAGDVVDLNPVSDSIREKEYKQVYKYIPSHLSDK